MLPAIRIRALSDAPVRPDRAMVLYWMVAARRTRANYGLERAVHHAASLGKPLVVLEPLRVGYQWASDRLHQFVIDGMRDNAAALDGRAGITYWPYLEPREGAGRGLLAALAAHAAVVVTDDFPAFFLPRMAEAAAARLDVRLETVDSNGLLPLRAVDAVYPTAYAFRRALQKTLPAHLRERPSPDPVADMPAVAAWTVPADVSRRWPHALRWLDDGHSVADLPIDHGVGVTTTRGGAEAARARLNDFVEHDLAQYSDLRNVPDRDVTSRLSPYLHFGHIGAHEIFERVMARDGWLGHLPAKGTGAREGWWGVSAEAEAYLDEFVTWRELGYNMTSRRTDYDTFESLPTWARETLEEHADDPRDHLYSLDEFEEARTHDPLWNAAQTELRREGRIHNYLRMLWGKKILQWTRHPREALQVMIELNNKYALDGRDPNSYSGIFWVLGRYDRPWAPERPIFGVVRYMTSENTARKVSVKQYLKRYGPSPDLFT
ncbi:MAG: deoxyribodipyrimidine photolyase [Acidobacteria bacterium]|nr:deoxyribodipyrimidine photolyase [Acidobacteriota bacterium]